MGGRGRPFQKGQSGNPGGGLKKSPIVKKFQQTTYEDFINHLQHLGSLARDDLQAIVKDPKTPVFQLIFARVLFDAQNGKVESQKILFDRLWGKVKETDIEPAMLANHRPLQNATPEQLKNILDGNVLTLPSGEVGK